MRRVLCAALALALASLAAAALTAGTAMAHRAVGVRVGDNLAFVRVVVDFTEGPLRFHEVDATDPQPFGDGVARLRVSSPGIRTSAARVTALGVRVLVRQGTGSIFIEVEAQPQRFKYVSYFVLSGPERLVIDLWKAVPPVPGAQIRRAPDRCLTLGRFSVRGGRVTASGRERNLFEHSLVVLIRGAGGRLIRELPVTGVSGRWNAAFPYTVGRPQAGTLEAVALSAKDGALDCIVQVRVTLRS